LVAIRLKNLCDVGILPGRVTVLLISSIAVVRPKTVNGPAVVGASSRVRVPELGLQDETAGRLEAASVLDDRGIHAGKGEIIGAHESVVLS